MTHVIWIWIALAVLVAVVAFRRLRERRARRSSEFVVDDDAIERILRHGTLATSDDEPLDEGEIARAEEEFWEQSWDEPEDFGR